MDRQVLKEGIQIANTHTKSPQRVPYHQPPGKEHPNHKQTPSHPSTWLLLRERAANSVRMWTKNSHTACGHCANQHGGSSENSKRSRPKIHPSPANAPQRHEIVMSGHQFHCTCGHTAHTAKTVKSSVIGQ